MRIAKLKKITLLSSNVPASLYNEYSSGIPYSKTDKVKVSYEADGTTPRWPVEEYESNVDSNSGNYPPDDTANWYPLGSENRGAMFDEYLNSQTNNTEAIEVTIDASRCNIVGLFNMTAKSVSFTHIVETEYITGGDCSSDSFFGEPGWSYDAVNQEYDCSGVQTEATSLYQAINTTENKNYQVVFTLKNHSAGTVAGLAGGTEGESMNSNGTYTRIIRAGSAQESGIIASADFVGSVTNISIKKVPRHETVNLATGAASGWYSYLFSRREYKKDILWEFPSYSNATLKIVITWVSGEPAKCGMVGIGEQRHLGVIRESPALGLLSYSIKTTDTFGRTTTSKGEGAKENEYDFWATKKDVDRLYRLLAGLDGERVIFDGNNIGAKIIYESQITYGIYRDFKIFIPGRLRSKCTIIIDGLI